jgi:hypothetical protein
MNLAGEQSDARIEMSVDARQMKQLPVVSPCGTVLLRIWWQADSAQLWKSHSDRIHTIRPSICCSAQKTRALECYAAKD